MNFNLDRFWSTDDINLTTSIQVPQVFIRCNNAATAAAQCLKITENVSFTTMLIKRATFTFSFKQCYKSGQFFKRTKNWWKMPKLENSNATFWVIFKQCALLMKNRQEFQSVFFASLSLAKNLSHPFVCLFQLIWKLPKKF